MDKDKPRQVMRTRYRDTGKGEKVRRTETVTYSYVSTSLKERIAEADLTVHELTEQIIVQDKISNLHLAQISSENVTEEDIDWP